jgi:hypothetical protein
MTQLFSNFHGNTKSVFKKKVKYRKLNRTHEAEIYSSMEIYFQIVTFGKYHKSCKFFISNANILLSR